jgi:chromosome partitioning protein
MTTIAVMNFKGGVGKTTLAVLLANEFANRKRRVLLLDCDPQSSALGWQQWSGTTIEVQKVEKIRVGKPLGPNHDVVILDCPPRYGEQCIAAAIVADVAVVPVMAGALDLAATTQLVSIVAQANTRRTSVLPVVFVANRVAPRTRMNSVLLQTLKKMAGGIDGAKVAKVPIPQRTAYVEALTGKWQPLSREANLPIEALCDELLGAS